MNLTLEEQKQMISAAFDKLSDKVKQMKVIPTRISIPYHQNGKWIRLSLDISAIRTEDPEEV